MTWTMPEWMEKYRELFQNTGGNTIERLMNLTGADTWGNVILAGLCVSVDAQITFLHRLKNAGLLSRELKAELAEAVASVENFRRLYVDEGVEKDRAEVRMKELEGWIWQLAAADVVSAGAIHDHLGIPYRDVMKELSRLRRKAE